MPRTTIDIDPTVLHELKVRARRNRRSIGQVASELLAGALDATTPPAPRRLEWISQPMDALVDLEDKEALRRAIEPR